MTILKGYERATGEMPTGKTLVDKQTGEVTQEMISYDKYTLHYVSDERQTCKGLYCDNIGAKAENLQIIGAKCLDDVIGKVVVFGMDMTGKPDRNGRVIPVVTSIVLVGEVKEK